MKYLKAIFIIIMLGTAAGGFAQDTTGGVRTLLERETFQYLNDLQNLSCTPASRDLSLSGNETEYFCTPEKFYDFVCKSKIEDEDDHGKTEFDRVYDDAIASDPANKVSCANLPASADDGNLPAGEKDPKKNSPSTAQLRCAVLRAKEAKEALERDPDPKIIAATKLRIKNLESELTNLKKEKDQIEKEGVDVSPINNNILSFVGSSKGSFGKKTISDLTDLVQRREKEYHAAISGNNPKVREYEYRHEQAREALKSAQLKLKTTQENIKKTEEDLQKNQKHLEIMVQQSDRANRSSERRATVERKFEQTVSALRADVGTYNPEGVGKALVSKMVGAGKQYSEKDPDPSSPYVRAKNTLEDLKNIKIAQLQVERDQVLKQYDNLEKNPQMFELIFQHYQNQIEAVKATQLDKPQNIVDSCIGGQKNAFVSRSSGANSATMITPCPALILGDPAELAGHLARALGHVLDPCAFEKNPALSKISIRGRPIAADGKKTISEFKTFSTDLLQDGVRACIGEQMKGGAASSRATPVSAGRCPANLAAEELETGVYKKNYDSTNAALAEVQGARILADYSASQNGEKGPEDRERASRLEIRKAFQPLCAQKISEDEGKGFRPDPKKLLTRVIATDSKVRAVMGCPVKNSDQSCEPSNLITKQFEKLEEKTEKDPKKNSWENFYSTRPATHDVVQAAKRLSLDRALARAKTGCSTSENRALVKNNLKGACGLDRDAKYPHVIIESGKTQVSALGAEYSIGCRSICSCDTGGCIERGVQLADQKGTVANNLDNRQKDYDLIVSGGNASAVHQACLTHEPRFENVCSGRSQTYKSTERLPMKGALSGSYFLFECQFECYCDAKNNKSCETFVRQAPEFQDPIKNGITLAQVNEDYSKNSGKYFYRPDANPNFDYAKGTSPTLEQMMEHQNPVRDLAHIYERSRLVDSKSHSYEQTKYLEVYTIKQENGNSKEIISSGFGVQEIEGKKLILQENEYGVLDYVRQHPADRSDKANAGEPYLITENIGPYGTAKLDESERKKIETEIKKSRGRVEANTGRIDGLGSFSRIESGRFYEKDGKKIFQFSGLNPKGKTYSQQYGTEKEFDIKKIDQMEINHPGRVKYDDGKSLEFSKFRIMRIPQPSGKKYFIIKKDSTSGNGAVLAIPLDEIEEFSFNPQ